VPGDLQSMVADIVKKVWKEKGLTEGEIDVALTKYFSHTLFNGVQTGYGATLEESFDTPDFEFLNQLKKNVFHFSAAKNNAQLKALSQALLDDKGELRSFAQFRIAAAEINNDFVDVWLKTEYNFAVASAQMASKWKKIESEKDIFPLLQYETAGDERVRLEHQELEGVIQPVDSEFWNTYYPPNGWNCRCDVRQLATGKITPLNSISFPDKMPPMFKFNAGKRGIIFPPGHPYYDNLPSNVEKVAEQLLKEEKIVPPPVKKIKPDVFIEAKTIKEAEQWAMQNSKGEVDYFDNVTRRFRGSGKTLDGGFKFRSMTLEQANKVNQWLLEANKLSDKIGIPRLRGMQPIRKHVLANMGDGVMGYTKAMFNQETGKISEWKPGDELSKRPFLSDEFFKLGERYLGTLWHEYGHQIHQRFGVTDASNLKTPILEQKMVELKDRKSASKYGLTNRAEWFAENFAMMKMGRMDLVDKTFIDFFNNFVLKNDTK
jgi:SPP1 gp7 family putative phage head morphogenesis protein